jgi:hypothetical protein
VEGVCPACLFVQTKTKGIGTTESLVYQDIVHSFKSYIKPYVSVDKQYDCLIGVSGGKDSTAQALFARDVLGLNPLLVCLLFPAELVSRLGTHNLGNLSCLGFDVHTIQLAPRDWRSLMLLGFKQNGNPLTSTEQALYSSVPQFAMREGYRLILWGENPALQLGDMKQLGKDAFDGNRLRKANTVKDGNLDWCKELHAEVGSLSRYQYPSVDEYEKYGLKTVYMGPVMDDWSMLNNTRRSVLNGFDVRNEKAINIGDRWGAMALDQNVSIANQRVKYLKYGFGRMTDYMNDQIRCGLITRNEAMSYVVKFDGKCSPSYFKKLAKYMCLGYDEFCEILDGYVNRSLFRRIGLDIYEPLFTVGEGL